MTSTAEPLGHTKTKALDNRLKAVTSAVLGLVTAVATNVEAVPTPGVARSFIDLPAALRAGRQGPPPARRPRLFSLAADLASGGDRTRPVPPDPRRPGGRRSGCAPCPSRVSPPAGGRASLRGASRDHARTDAAARHGYDRARRPRPPGGDPLRTPALWTGRQYASGCACTDPSSVLEARDGD